MTHPSYQRSQAPREPVGGTPSLIVYFDPDKPERELFDTLAEQQAKVLPIINSSQLRRFFGELKELYRRFEQSRRTSPDRDEQALFAEEIEPLFRMVRSKVAYAAGRPKHVALDRSYQEWFDSCIRKVRDVRDFRRYILHLEAVVGFLYGNNKVKDGGRR
jgi:CRISPR type III-A-associated protein Csm2